MFLGIDVGTSAVKVVLVDGAQTLVDQSSEPLSVDRPRPNFSEQDPRAWWEAVRKAVSALRERRPKDLAAVRAIGLSGQMHGAVLLDASHRPLRPAILWNDGRSVAECAELERRVPTSRTITGNIAMPGFTAPKLLWVAANEPEVFRATAKVLLPKDYVRLELTGDFASDLSDSAGTLWLDVGERRWSEAMLDATMLGERHMPTLYEGSQATGTLRPELAAEWGMRADVVVAAGAGDNAAGAVGVGVVHPGEAFLSLGTSGVYFVSNEGYAPNPGEGLHTFCHALPRTWHQMSVLLSAASCLTWAKQALGAPSEGALVAELEAAPPKPSSVFFLPYLSGERTPHNDPDARGVFFGIGHETSRLDLAQAVLEGVAFAFADGQDAIAHAGTAVRDVTVIGGGARSAYWGRILASVLDRPLTFRKGAEVGPSFGAARLARMALSGESAREVCVPPPVDHVVEPDRALVARYGEARPIYQKLYADLRDAFGGLARKRAMNSSGGE